MTKKYQHISTKEHGIILSLLIWYVSYVEYHSGGLGIKGQYKVSVIAPLSIIKVTQSSFKREVEWLVILGVTEYGNEP